VVSALSWTLSFFLLLSLSVPRTCKTTLHARGNNTSNLQILFFSPRAASCILWFGTFLFSSGTFRFSGPFRGCGT
jgi:hypothetical protein